MAILSGQGKRVSELQETINVFSGWLLPVMGSGSLFKCTLDTFFRYHNNTYYLGDNADPLATDIYNNNFGRYHFGTYNFGISGNPLAHFRLEQVEVNISKSGSQSPTPFAGETLYSGLNMPAAVMLENLAAVDNSYTILGSKGTGHNMGAHINFIQTGEDEDAFGIGFFTRTPLANNTRLSAYLSDLGRFDLGSGYNGDAALRIMGTGGTEQTTFKLQNNNNASFRIKAKDDTNSTVWTLSGGADSPISFERGGAEAFRIATSGGHMGFGSIDCAVSGYQFNGEVLITGNLMIENSGVTIADNWYRPTAKLDISGSNPSGDGIKIKSQYDAFIRIDADIDDSPEGDNPYILMTQDGYGNSGIFGMCSGSNVGQLGPITGALANATIITNEVRAGNVGGIQLAVQNKTYFTLTSGGAIGVGYNNFAPSGVFHVSGSGVYLDYDNMHTADPQRKGEVYRNGSNQLFISAG